MDRSKNKYERMRMVFEGEADPEDAAGMAAYMKNQFPFYGLKTPVRRKLCRDFLKAEKKAGHVDWDFLDLCYQDPHREFQYLVYDYLTRLESFLTLEDIPRIRIYIQTKSWWDTVDQLRVPISRIGMRDSSVDGIMEAWSRDPDFWIRRTAIEYQIGRKENTNRELLEKILVCNFGSEEFFINKAIGWALRDFSKTDPVWVRGFLSRHREKMSRLSVREAGRYISWR